jgi:DNA-binding LacI/PurR family transcriptional regulator
MSPLVAEPVRLTAGENVAEARAAVAAALSGGSAPVDALVCASDSLAVGAHLATVAAGRSDLPVIGFDNTPVCEAIGISSVEQLPEEVASGTLSLLLDAEDAAENASAGRAQHVLVEPRLIVRDDVRRTYADRGTRRSPHMLRP